MARTTITMASDCGGGDGDCSGGGGDGDWGDNKRPLRAMQRNGTSEQSCGVDGNLLYSLSCLLGVASSCCMHYRYVLYSLPLCFG